MLLIDGDPQCNLTSFYAPNPNDWDSINFKKKVKRGNARKGTVADLNLSAVRPVEKVLPATIRAKIGRFSLVHLCCRASSFLNMTSDGSNPMHSRQTFSTRTLG